MVSRSRDLQDRIPAISHLINYIMLPLQWCVTVLRVYAAVVSLRSKEARTAERTDEKDLEGLRRAERAWEEKREKAKTRGGARHAFPLFIDQAQSVEPVVMIDWQAGFRKIPAD